jgi:hypothetical protein
MLVTVGLSEFESDSPMPGCQYCHFQLGDIWSGPGETRTQLCVYYYIFLHAFPNRTKCLHRSHGVWILWINTDFRLTELADCGLGWVARGGWVGGWVGGWTKLEALAQLQEMGFLPALEAAARQPDTVSCKELEAGRIDCQKVAPPPPPAMAAAAALASLRRHGGRMEAVVQDLLSGGSSSTSSGGGGGGIGHKSNADKSATTGQHLHTAAQRQRHHETATSAATAAAKKRPAGQTDLRAAFGLAGKQGRRT